MIEVDIDPVQSLSLSLSHSRFAQILFKYSDGFLYMPIKIERARLCINRFTNAKDRLVLLCYLAEK